MTHVRNIAVFAAIVFAIVVGLDEYFYTLGFLKIGEFSSHNIAKNAALGAGMGFFVIELLVLAELFILWLYLRNTKIWQKLNIDVREALYYWFENTKTGRSFWDYAWLHGEPGEVLILDNDGSVKEVMNQERPNNIFMAEVIWKIKRWAEQAYLKAEVKRTQKWIDDNYYNEDYNDWHFEAAADRRDMFEQLTRYPGKLVWFDV